MRPSKTNDQKEKWIHSACAMCLAAPMKVRVRNHRIIEVRGEDIPGFHGKLCGKAMAGIGGRIYAPDRILYPLKRIGERGEGKFVRCSWEEVIEAVAAKVKEYTDGGHPEFFEIWWGCPVQTDNIFFLHYWAAVMRAGISYLHGQICFGDHLVEKTVTFGRNHGQYLLQGTSDLSRTRYAVIAGQNFPGTSREGGGSCAANCYSLFLKARENGCKFVSIDPKLADSTPWCNEWVPIRPGSDANFALSIANTLIKEKLYDEDFLLKYTNAPQLIKEDGRPLRDKDGNYLAWDAKVESPKPLPAAGEGNGLTLGLGKTFDVALEGQIVKCKTALEMFAEEAKKHPPENTDFPDKTVEIARNLGTQKPSVIFFPGFTSGRYPNWFQVLRAYSATNLLLGNFERPGGFYITKKRFQFAERRLNIGVGWPEPPEVPEYREGITFVPGPQGNMMEVQAIDKEPCYKDPPDFHPDTVALPWLHFEAIEKGKVKAVLSTAENAAVTQPDAKYVWDCLKKLDLIIVGEQVPKEFVDLADYVLPEASFLERSHLYGYSSIGLNDKEVLVTYMRSPAIPPQGESKPISWFLSEVAKRVGKEEYFEKLDLDFEWWDRALKKAGLYPRVTAKKLAEKGPYVEEHPMTYNILYKPIATRSGRFEIYSNELAEDCYHNQKSRWYRSPYVSPLPIHIPLAGPQGDDEFYLICGKATWHQKSATQHERYLMEDAIEGDCSYSSIYLNTARAQKLGIQTGDWVEVECIGPTKKDDPCVLQETAIGRREKARVKVTEGLHPAGAWVFFASGHKSPSMLPKVRESLTYNWLLPLSVAPYAAGTSKNYSIVRISKLDEGIRKNG